MLTTKTSTTAQRFVPTFTIVFVLTVVALRPPLQPLSPRWPDVDVLNAHTRWLLNQTSGNWEPVSPRERTRTADVNGVWESSLPVFAISALPSWQSNPVVVWNDARNEFLVVWEDARNGTDIDLYARRVSSDGSLLGEEIAIATGVHDQAAPVLLHMEISEGYVVLWHHREPGHYRIHGRRLTPEGSATGAPFHVPSDQSHPQWIPGAAYNASEGEFLVVWEDMVNSALLCQRYSAGGTPLGNIVLVSSSPESQWVPPVVTFAPARQEYLVIWDALAEGDIRAVTLARDGTAPGPEYKVSAAPGRQLVSDAVCASEAEECLVVWTDERAWETHDADIYAQLVGRDGSILSQDLALAAAPGAQRDGRARIQGAGTTQLTSSPNRHRLTGRYRHPMWWQSAGVGVN